MKTRSRHAFASAPGAAAIVVAFAALVAAGLAGCAGAPPAPAAQAAESPPPPADPRLLEADLGARLDALRRQPDPASDDMIVALERTLREQRERRARAIVAAGGAAAPASAAVAAATPASAPAKPPKGKAARPAAARAAKAKASAAAPDREPPAAAAAAPAEAAAPAATVAVAATGSSRTPMSPIAETRVPVDELYERARGMELQLQTAQAIDLYREASQRGHAASSRRLMELYADGAPGVARDYRVAVFFKERALQQGASFDPAWRR
jgi:hypothetical protein